MTVREAPLWLDAAYRRAFVRWLLGRPYDAPALARWRNPDGSYPVPTPLDPTRRAPQ